MAPSCLYHGLYTDSHLLTLTSLKPHILPTFLSKLTLTMSITPCLYAAGTANRQPQQTLRCYVQMKLLTVTQRKMAMLQKCSFASSTPHRSMNRKSSPTSLCMPAD